MAVTKAARDRRVFGLLVAAALFLPPAMNFVVGGARSRVARPANIRLRATGSLRMPLPELNPLPWAADLEGAEALQHDGNMKALEKCIELICSLDESLPDTSTSESLREHDSVLAKRLTFEQLKEYEGTLAAGAQELEDKIAQTQGDLLRDSMEVRSEAQLAWLESMLHGIDELREQLRRVRIAEGQLRKRIATGESSFLEKVMQAAAVAFSGHRAVLHSDYPASGVSSFTGEPTRML
eukprot:TRINITY_DN1015_c0_g1_i4.p1 TRINITY_DN1015_c0_g1~~TRINITY_DN1015_c0_g1_i4.p1  ORF type:complete len:238 (-),score=55.05 TRINITY_DN1015_c0_g1_i4:295-1008(-)